LGNSAPDFKNYFPLYYQKLPKFFRGIWSYSVPNLEHFGTFWNDSYLILSTMVTVAMLEV